MEATEALANERVKRAYEKENEYEDFDFMGNQDVFFSSLSHPFLEFFSNLNPLRFGLGAVL